MEVKNRTKRALPAWIVCLAGILAVWLALSGIGYALSGDTTLNASIDDISISAGLPVTYSAKVSGEDFVYDENGNLVYDENPVTEEAAASCVAWNFNGSAGTLRGEVCALYNEGCMSNDMQSVKAELVFTNTNATADMILSFDYSYTTAEGGGNFVGLVSGANASESGNVTVTIAPGESRSISVYSGSLGGVDSAQEEYGKATLNLSNISVTNANATYNVTLKPANYGTYQASFTDAEGTAQTYVITNQAVTPELEAAYPGANVVAAAQAISFRLNSGLTLTSLTANDNFRFDHWQAGSNSLGTDTTVNIIPADGSEVTAVFLQESYINAFTVGNKQFYSWNAAIAEAQASGNMIILNQNYTFPATMADATAAGEMSGSYVAENGSGLTYTLPAGVRFVVPKSEGDFGNFTNNLPAGVTATTPITHFRTLTVPGGVTLQINGEISINGDYYCKQPYETVAGGAHGLVSLNENAKINVSNGGKIWCYGFIAGAGEVEIASGGHAAEFLQITDWGGGSAALGWAMNASNLYNAFYFSQYYVQNIEAKLTVYEGATTECAVAIVASGQVACSHAPFIGEGGLFHLTSLGGHITRTYNSVEDRVSYDVYGDMETSGITVSIMQYKLASDSYVLGITGNLSINVEEGETTLLNDFMLLPGTEINVASGASVEVAQSAELSHIDMQTGETVTEERPIRLFIIDDYEWNNTIDTSADPLTQLQQLNNGSANYSYPRKQSTLPYTIANGDDNGDIRGNVTAESASINVDGTATFYSNVFTTNYIGQLYDTMREMLDDPDTRAAMVAQYGAATVAWAEGVVNAAYENSKDKLVTGSGTIINNEAMEGIDGSLNLLTQSGTNKNQVSIPVSGVLGALNDDGTYSEFTPGTYHIYVENGETIWYKNQITYHFITVDPATQQPTGTLSDINHKTANDYDVLTVDDLTIGGQRYAVFGFDTSNLYTTMKGVPIGFVPEDGVIVYWEENNSGVKQPNFNLEGDSQNRNFETPASWNELMTDTQTLMTYLMSNGVTDGWDTAGFVFADLTQMNGGLTAMMSGNLSGEVTLYVVPYDYYVAWENTTSGERAQSYLPSGVTTAQYEMEGEATLTTVYSDPATGNEVTGVSEAQSQENMTTILTLTDVNQDLLATITASYTKVNLTWKFVDADDDTIVYATETTSYDITDPAAESPAFTNADHPYYVMHGDQNTALANRYPSIANVVTLSNEETATGTATLDGVSLTGITEPVTIFVRVDAYDYKLSFTDDKDDAAVEDFYVKDGDDLTLTVSNILSEGKYCFDTASVTGTAAATVMNSGAELAITEIASDATIDLGLREYDYLVTFINWSSSTKVGYSFVEAGEDAVYTYEEGKYSFTYTQNFNNGTAYGDGLSYTPAWENQPAVLTVGNITADRIVDIKAGDYDRALAVRGENDEILWLVYTSYEYLCGPYRFPANTYMTGYTLGASNPAEAALTVTAIKDSVHFELPSPGYYDITFQGAHYAHYVQYSFKTGGSATGSRLNDDDWNQLQLCLYTDEEGGSATLTTAQFQALIAERGCKDTAIANAGDNLFFYLVTYAEQGSGAAATLTTAADAKSIIATGINNNLTVDVIVIPYANTVTVTDSGLGTTSLYYVDANGKDITNSYNFTGTADVTYAAGSNRGIFGVSGLTNASIDATAEEIEAGVDSVTFSNITGEASATLDTHGTKHKLTIQYVEPWGSTTETVYPDGDEYTVSFDDRSIVQATVTSEDGSTASSTANSFTVSMPDAVTTTRVVVEFRYTAERLKYNLSDPSNSNITNASGTTRKTATIEVVDSYYGIFNVECPNPCVVVIDNGDGTYTRLDAVAVYGEEDTYQFTCPDNFSSDIAIVVAVKGDINGDGRLTSRDSNFLSRSRLSPTNDQYLELTGIAAFLADTDENGRLTSRDVTRMKSALLADGSPFEW